LALMETCAAPRTRRDPSEHGNVARLAKRPPPLNRSAFQGSRESLRRACQHWLGGIHAHPTDHRTRNGRFTETQQNQGVCQILAQSHFLDICRQRGWSTAGVEPSDFAASLGRNKGLDVRTGVLPDCGFAPGSFDAVTLWDVLEHVPDPEKTVQDVVQLLKPGGIFAFNTPNVDSAWARTMGMHWHLIVPPEHIHLFGRKSAVELLTKCAFLPLEVTTIGKTFTIQYVLKTLGQWLKLPLFTRSAEWMRGTRLGSLLGNLAVPINLRDNMFVMARLKPEQRI